MEDIVKKQIGDYELLSIIGDGAQGRVYKACALSDTASGLSKETLVALKVVNIAGEDEDMRLRFRQQSEILRRLSHDSIVKYIDSFVWHAGELDECQCLVMEYLEGEDLTSRIKNFPAGLGWSQVEDIFEKCLAGLIHARECGITHRDLKPSNIYLTKAGGVKLIDFDIAKKDDSEQLSTAGWKGTFDYMAPDFITQEGFRGDEISDVFSLGVCFYQALTGTLPYEPLGSNAHIGYVNRWHGGTSKPPSFRAGVFRVLAGAKEFVAKAISVRRDGRYQSFAEMLEDFRKIHYRVVRHKGKEDYELLSLLGRGGFGEVFKARCASDGTLVAVKHLFSEKQSDRFIKEAKILQRYNHENLVRYVDFMQQETDTGNKQFFLVMEYLEGMPGWTLRLRIKNEGRLSIDETIKLFKVYLSALHFMHSHARPIIHRDIKPGNLYAPLGRPEKGKIFDMGVARDVSGTVTTGGVPGTLDYMAPEFADASGDRGSPQSDIYALGLCFYETLTGNPVYARLPQDINSAWSGFIGRVKNPPSISFDDPIFAEYPRLAGIAAKSLALNPDDRYASAQAMIDDLDLALTPNAPSSIDDDLFDDMELTMATSPGGGAATLGTRPMDGDINDYLKKIDAKGKRKGGKNISKSTLIVRLAIAALGVAVAGGALWMGVAVITGKGKKTLGAEPPARMAVNAEPAAKVPETPAAKEPKTIVAAAVEPAERTLEPPAVKEPEKVATKMPEVKPLLQPEPIVKKEPVQVPVAQPQPKPVVVIAADYPDALAIQGLIAEKFSDEKSVSDAHQAMLLLVEAEKKQWQGVPTDEKRKFIAEKRAEITIKFNAYIKLVVDRVVELAGAGKDAQSTYQPLLGLKESAPLLVAYSSKAYQDGCAAADGAIRVRKAGDAMAELTAKAADATDVPTLNEQVAKYRQLAAMPATAIDQPQREQFEKTTAAQYAALAESQYLEFKKACDSDNLPRASEIERDFLRWAAAVTHEFGKVQLLEKAKAFAADYKQAAARQAQGTAGKTGVAEAAPARKAAPDPLPAKPKEVAQVVQPPKDTPAPLPTKAAAQPPADVDRTKSYLEISISPDTATLQVDGHNVEAGKIEVEPDKNHRIEVSSPGYKSVKQFYKIPPGDTRKVDVLLQKGSSRSIFGF